jgi:hypothetical protein
MEYATVKQIGKNTFAVVDSANQCRFCTPSELKANNFLKKLLKQANQN